MEADPRHAREAIRALGLEGASPATAPGVAAKGETRVEDNEGSTDPGLNREETTMFRAVGARPNYLSKDRSDITFATMKLCSKMSRQDAHDLKNLKRVGRFLVGRPRVGCPFEWPAHPGALHALADAGWARQREHDLAREAPDQSFRRSPKTWVESSRFDCTSTPVRHCP